MTHAPTNIYRGRFAPSPTGSLHLGSLYTALASFLEARAQEGLWFVRIDDIDTPRCLPGADTRILKTLERFGLCWDGTVDYQSNNLERYRTVLEKLEENGRLYPCTCSRKKLEGAGPVYPGWCRGRPRDRTQPHALRVRVDPGAIVFEDRLQGRFTQNLAAASGDFIVYRRDKIHAYQLAVVADDHAVGITEILRGCDLLDNTPRQIYLQQLLQLPTPNYCHIPILVNPEGQKLSKQTGAPAVDECKPGPLLHALLGLLGQSPPRELLNAPPKEILSWAIAHWRIDGIPKCRQIAIMPSFVPDIRVISA